METSYYRDLVARLDSAMSAWDNYNASHEIDEAYEQYLLSSREALLSEVTDYLYPIQGNLVPLERIKWKAELRRSK
jgi:hypothetical protein